MNTTQSIQMAVIKRVVILANSIKNSGRCLAGKELRRTRGGWEQGGWIRIVGTEDGGEVPVSWMLEQLGREPRLLDIIDIPLEGMVPLPDQPENWLMVRRAPWREKGMMPQEDAPRLLDFPLKLWGTQKRSVDAGYVDTMGEPASLYLIQPEVVEPIRVWTEDSLDPSGGHFDRHCRRITIRYRRSFHEFTVTDPVLQAEYYPDLPRRGDPVLTVPISLGSPIYMSVSLTPPWHGKQYKIAAGFIRLKSDAAESP